DGVGRQKERHREEQRVHRASVAENAARLLAMSASGPTRPAAPFELPTPLRRAASLCRDGCEVYIKDETVLPTGSFKVRGALHSLRANLARRAIAEVVAASTGNHGAAVAYAGRQLGVRTTIVLPVNPNVTKADRIRALGARIVESGVDLSGAIDAAAAYAERTGAFFLHDASDPDVPDGTAAIGAEIAAQRPDVRRVYVPMGDTALIRGVAHALERALPTVSIVGVVATGAPAYRLSWQQRRRVETPTADTIADGLAIRRPLDANVAAILRLVDDVHAVTDDEMMEAMRLLDAREGHSRGAGGRGRDGRVPAGCLPRGRQRAARHRRQPGAGDRVGPARARVIRRAWRGACSPDPWPTSTGGSRMFSVTTLDLVRLDS